MYASLNGKNSLARRGARPAATRSVERFAGSTLFCLAILLPGAWSVAAADEGQGAKQQSAVSEAGSDTTSTNHADENRSTLEKRFEARDLSVNPLRPSKKPEPISRSDDSPTSSQISPSLPSSPIVAPAPKTAQKPAQENVEPVQKIERLPEPISDPTFQFITGQISADEAFVKTALAESSAHSISDQFAASFASYYSQEEAPLPPPDLGGKDARPATGGLGSSNNGADSDGKLGQAPEDFSLQFLRTQTVLLDPGEWQLDVGLEYTLFENDFPTVTVPGNVLVEGRFRERLLVMPLELRYGLSTYAQVYLNVPIGWVNTEIVEPGFDAFGNGGGLGDIRGGLTWQIRESSGCGCDPDVIMNFGFTAPTGNESLLQLLLGSPPDDLGEGVWAGSWSVLFIHTYDPIAVFYGVGSRHRVERNFNGILVTPGDEYIYQLGLGFAVNESVTLSTSFLGEYITEPKINGQRIQGLIQEPMRLRFAATIANACRCSIVEPFAEIGMTRDAPSARIGMTWTF